MQTRVIWHAGAKPFFRKEFSIQAKRNDDLDFMVQGEPTPSQTQQLAV